MDNQPKNPLHGVTLEQILVELEQRLGFKAMGEQVNIKCFTDSPSIKSSLKFLRKTPWARDKVEALYLHTLSNKPLRKPKSAQRPKPASQSDSSDFVWPSIKK
ncbi:VF530 family protein [Pseudoalteromonas sp. Angola-30]|uniref:VF530 family protein n=1 Tax=Pseudoalteromonas sp. Angola-30 TaxID=3025341 RepID=UPI002359E21C|nr:VF530 family protein [Pseudoalteromonas sp. Angola-30]MDC9524426.1 VF530 family protein [Pseudoalteromonas sp. Angola-30]